MFRKRRVDRQILKTVLLIFLFVFTGKTSLAQAGRQDFVEKEDVSKDSTLDVVTWNIEWFGSSDNGPEDLDLQMNNVIKVIKTIDADLFAFQEIVDKTRFFTLDDSLETYRGFVSNYSQPQQTAYLFRESVIDSVDSGLLSARQSDFNWAGRLPLFFEFDVTIAGKTLRVFSYNIHAKAFADQAAYNRRQAAANSLKRYLDESRQNASVIILGDFNDQLITSTYQEEPSPYQPFIEDNFYFPITQSLEEEGAYSYLPEEYQSMIDHIMTTNVLKNIHMDGAQRVENPDYIDNFVSTTSDHAPVWTRFDFTIEFEDPYEELPDAFSVAPNYPNPFNPSTTIPFSLSEPSDVTITVFDILGREISVLTDGKPYPAGEHTVHFKSEGLPGGIYLYRIELDSGLSKTEKMTLIK